MSNRLELSYDLQDLILSSSDGQIRDAAAQVFDDLLHVSAADNFLDRSTLVGADVKAMLYGVVANLLGRSIFRKSFTDEEISQLFDAHNQKDSSIIENSATLRADLFTLLESRFFEALRGIVEND